MNFHQLRIFHTVATHGSFTQAANELLLTQPAVSIQIQKLEEEYQTKLFDRVGKKVLLTEAGRILLEYAASILDLSKQADTALQDLHALKAGSLEIGAGLTLGAYYVPEIISRFSKKYPQISVRMHLANSFQVQVLSFAPLRTRSPRHGSGPSSSKAKGLSSSEAKETILPVTLNEVKSLNSMSVKIRQLSCEQPYLR